VAAKRAGAKVVYADCNRDDLCLSLEDLKSRVTDRTRAVAVVHIGGHIAFEIEALAAFCAERGIALIEDCAHAHGATWDGRSAGSWGLAGVYSFYATKTMPLGEGGMVVSRDADFCEWLRHFRNYGKHVESGKVTYRFDNGFNFRMGEVAAALGNVQMDRLTRILEWKRALAAKFDGIFENRVRMPDGMVSGYYKYIVFDTPLKEETGQVFGRDDLGYNIDRDVAGLSLPNTEWVVDHHHCAPIWYGWPQADQPAEELAKLLV
jgi:dTDP-4-amino-4,6-dideoxygalactose transaminase